MNPVARQRDNTEPLLLPPRAAPYLLTDVLEKRVRGCRDELVLCLGDSHLRFVVDNETDTIMSEFKPSPFRATKGYTSILAAAPWMQNAGRECGSTWFGWNQQGYLDMVVLSFDGMEPSVLLQTTASSIEVFTVSRTDGSDKVSVNQRITNSDHEFLLGR